MHISIDPSDFSAYTLSGSPTNEVAEALDAQKSEMIELYESLTQQYRKSQPGPERDAIEVEMNILINKIYAIDYAFIENNPNSIFAAYLLTLHLGGRDLKTTEAWYNTFSPSVKNSSYGKKVIAYIQRTLRGEPGKEAQLFVRNDINGNELNLPELNKEYYLLIDYWASWCGPCRRGNPHMKEIYKKYGPKGLLVVCVSCDDTPDKWKQAIEEDGIGEFRHVLVGLDCTADGFVAGEDLHENFGVSAIPTQFLIDKNGIIIHKSVGLGESEALDNKLVEIFGE